MFHGNIHSYAQLVDDFKLLFYTKVCCFFQRPLKQGLCDKGVHFILTLENLESFVQLTELVSVISFNSCVLLDATKIDKRQQSVKIILLLLVDQTIVVSYTFKFHLSIYVIFSLIFCLFLKCRQQTTKSKTMLV